MPDAAGNIKGIATTGKAGETIEQIFKHTVPSEDSPVPSDRRPCKCKTCKCAKTDR